MAESSAVQQPITELDETAVIARDLIRFDTTNYGEGRAKGEREAAEYVEAKLAALGLAPQLFEPEPRRTSVVARVPGRDPDKPALVLHGHLDVVPADAAQLERRPVRRRGPRRDAVGSRRRRHEGHGRDDAHRARRHPRARARCPSASSSSRSSPTRRPAAGSARSWLVDHHPELFDGATEAISEVGGYSITVGGERAYLLQTGEKSLIWVRLVAHGVAAHGSRLIRDNAVTKLAEAIARLGRTEWPLHLTDTTRELLAAIADMLGVDPEQVAPDELALATGSASGFITGDAPHHDEPDDARGRLQAQRDPRPRRGARRHPHPARARRTRCSPRCASIIGDDIEIEFVHRDVGLEEPTRGAARRRGEPIARDARSGRARVPVPALGRHRQQVAQPRSASPATASRRCGCRPTSTSRRCSTASTSACRSTH